MAATHPESRPVRRALVTFGALLVLAAGGLAGCATSGSPATLNRHSVDGPVSLADTAPPSTDGTGDTVDTLAPATVVTAGSVTVDAIDNDFTPKNITIKAGTAVTFDNTGHNTHDITPDDPSRLDFTVASDDFGIGKKATFTFNRPGTYPYYCSLHAAATAGSMRGFITVTS